MMTSSHLRLRLLPALVLLSAFVFSASPAASQAPQVAQVRVTRDRATIWRRDARIVATTVRKGVTLDAVAREGDWYVVVIPNAPNPNELGLIAVGVVELLPGSPALPDRAPPAPGTAASEPAPAVTGTSGVEFLGFGQVGVGRWLAHNTFDAVAGSAFFPMFGGGAEARFPIGLFVAGSVEYFQKQGQRVFVNNGTAFRLGIADRLRIIPIEGRVGYRWPFRNYSWYVAGGAGVYLYHEESDFSTGGDHVSETFASYHGLTGLEVPVGGTVRAAVEVEFTTVPGALGDGGASAAFGEHNLGGIQARIRFLAGR
jgi:hypothetical protein